MDQKYKELKRDLDVLLRLKARYRDLNAAMVILYVRVYRITSISTIAQDIGVNRSVVRRVLQKVSEKDT